MDTPAYELLEPDLLRQCRVDTFRSHGPGGQHANRTESAVRITHLDSAVVSQCQDHRERARNQADAVRRLRLRLALHVRGMASPTWLEPHRRGRQLALGPSSASYPRVVALVLDALQTASGSLAAAGATLGISASQIAKLLGADKEVLQAANKMRALSGLGPIQ